MFLLDSDQFIPFISDKLPKLTDEVWKGFQLCFMVYDIMSRAGSLHGGC